MKKQYLIPVVLMLVLGAYIFLKDDNQTHYTLPTPPGVDTAQIDTLTLKGPELDLTFNKNKDQWTVGTENFPADGAAVKEMLNTLADLQITALASEKGDLRRYELDPDQAIEVTAMEGNASLIRIKVGKPSVSGNHTFVMLEGDKRIFHAARNFRSQFQRDLDQFRNKHIFSLKPDQVTQFTVEIHGVDRTFMAQPHKASDKKADQPQKPGLSFVAQDGDSVDQQALSDLMSSLSDLTCQGFPQAPAREELEKSAPICKISLENGQTLVLNLFDQMEKALGTASTTPYTFELASYTAQDIRSYAEKLTRTEPERKDSDKE